MFANCFPNFWEQWEDLTLLHFCLRPGSASEVVSDSAFEDVVFANIHTQLKAHEHALELGVTIYSKLISILSSCVRVI